jgi:hypothetical protein
MCESLGCGVEDSGWAVVCESVCVVVVGSVVSVCVVMVVVIVMVGANRSVSEKVCLKW